MSSTAVDWQAQVDLKAHQERVAGAERLQSNPKLAADTLSIAQAKSASFAVQMVVAPGLLPKLLPNMKFPSHHHDHLASSVPLL